MRTGTGNAHDRIAQWQEPLDDVPFATAHGRDVREAIRAHVLESPYPILPVDIVRRWSAHRRHRLDRHTDPTPAADPDDPVAWRAELLHARNAVAVGNAAPSMHPQITSGGPPPDVEERLREIGSCIPPAVRAELARYRPTRAAREPPTPKVFPMRSAPVGVPCRQRRARPDGAARGNAALPASGGGNGRQVLDRSGGTRRPGRCLGPRGALS
ncbi:MULTISPECIES: hypothetical protein [Streptomyces]|uniref:hypothetical protein n=1 Tax=Streptomyces tendae TaxID=1932 RepID=UPI0037FAB82F